MTKGIITFILLFMVSIGFGQALPIDFESGITTSDFVDFSGGTGTVIVNPQSNGINTSATVGQIIRNGGDIWAGSKIILTNNLDFTTNNIISMKVFVAAPVGTVVKFKLEGGGSSAEKDALTTVTNTWETLTWDFTGTPNTFNEVVFMFDFGNVGDSSATSTFLFDDVEQVFGGSQIDLPVTFEDPNVNYTITDFEGNLSFIEPDPTNANNTVAKIVKNDQAGASAGTTIGTPAGFATDIPLTLSSSKMNVRVWSPDANIPVRLKVEDSNDPTHTCETEAMTTLAGAWETLEFDFANEAPGTAALSFGLSNGWTYNMASIFFNFGTDGATAGEKTYYFDNVKFGTSVSTKAEYEVEGLELFPNPTDKEWQITSEKAKMVLVEIFDLQGKRLLLVQPNENMISINAADFANGVYIAKVYTDLGVKSLKLMKQ